MAAEQSKQAGTYLNKSAVGKKSYKRPDSSPPTPHLPYSNNFLYEQDERTIQVLSCLVSSFYSMEEFYNRKPL